jgi:hypothetical protein
LIERKNPDADYFPVILLAFLAYGPLSLEGYSGWSAIPKDEGMGIIPTCANNVKPMSRRDLQQAKEDAQSASGDNNSSSSGKGSGKRKDSKSIDIPSNLDLAAPKIAEEMMLQRLIFERKEQINKYNMKIALMKEWKRPPDRAPTGSKKTGYKS